MGSEYCLYCMNHSSDDLCTACNKRASDYNAAPHHLKSGTVLCGKYLVGAVLGEGGFGITYIGRDINLDIKVAIKEYFPTGVVNRNVDSSNEVSVYMGASQSSFENGKSKFLGEARVLAKFSNEPNIVSVRDFFSENNTAYIVMEYLEGTDLKNYIASHGKMDFESSVSLLSPIMTALSKIHEQGLIHRDISPANIMILKDGTVKLLDFGAAREVGGADEKSLSILLKPGYAPEEQYRTKGNQGAWTDVYALSATMYKMMTGVTPVDAMNRIFSDELQKISELNPSVTKKQEAVILKGMAIYQADRYQSIGELYADCTSGFAKRSQSEDARTEKRENSSPVKNQTAKKPTAKKAYENNKRQTVNEKKPSKPAFVGSIMSGLLTMVMSLIAVSNYYDYDASPVLPAILAVVFAGATFALGRLYFPRLDNKNRKPNVACLVMSLVSVLYVIYCVFVTYVTVTDSAAVQGDSEFAIVQSVLSLVFPVFFGYFYYPRLERSKRTKFIKAYTGIGAVAVIVLVVSVVFSSFNSVTIGDEKIKRNATEVTLSFDIITDNDLAKLKELKKLEMLDITECFLDNNDVKTIGELTSLKRLYLKGNTDITDVSPLNNLTGLTYLDISVTNTEDISCLSNLNELEWFNFSGTKVSDVSSLSQFESLDTIKMDLLTELDHSTIKLPTNLYTLYCNGNGLENLEFVSGLATLSNIYASGNKISDLTPLSECPLVIVDLSVNEVSDISVLDYTGINSLDVSTNKISDISCLEGSKIGDLDLSYNNISDISSLKDNSRLQLVGLNNNRISDIRVLKDCFNIHSLNISYNEIADISVLETIDELEIFSARSNKISDISSLALCKNLIEGGYTLELRDNEIEDINALSAYTNTKHIYLSGNNISDVSPLKNCSSLEMLKLNDNNISDVSPIGSMSKLRILEVANNPISNLDSLNLVAISDGVGEKASLRISYNEGIDFSRFAGDETITVVIYDTPPRAQKALSEAGFMYFPDSSELDEIEENPDLAQEETQGEDENG